MALQMAYVPPRRQRQQREGTVTLTNQDEGVLNILFATGQTQKIHLVGHVLR